MFEAKHPWKIVRVSKRPLQLPIPKCNAIQQSCQALVTGLAFVDGKLIVSYSKNDENAKFYVSTAEKLFLTMENMGPAGFVLTNEMILHAQEHFVSALVEGPNHVDQGARLQRVVSKHLSALSNVSDTESSLTVYICGLFHVLYCSISKTKSVYRPASSNNCNNKSPNNM